MKCARCNEQVIIEYSSDELYSTFEISNYLGKSGWIQILGETFCNKCKQKLLNDLQAKLDSITPYISKEDNKLVSKLTLILSNGLIDKSIENNSLSIYPSWMLGIKDQDDEHIAGFQLHTLLLDQFVSYFSKDFVLDLEELQLPEIEKFMEDYKDNKEIVKKLQEIKTKLTLFGWE